MRVFVCVLVRGLLLLLLVATPSTLLLLLLVYQHTSATVAISTERVEDESGKVKTGLLQLPFGTRRQNRTDSTRPKRCTRYCKLPIPKRPSVLRRQVERRAVSPRLSP